MKFIFSLTCVWLALLVSPSSSAQTSQRSVVIGSMTSKPNALLVLNPADNNQGFLLPQLPTNSRLAMTPSSPGEDGLMVFDITEKQFYYWKNNGWVKGFGNNGQNNNSPPIVQYEPIDPADFTGLQTATATNNNPLLFEDNTTYIAALQKNQGTSFIAAVHLPDGATIQKINVFYMDRDDQNITLNVYRRPFTGDNEAIVQPWSSTGTSTAIQKMSLTPLTDKDVVDNSNYSYRVVIGLNPSLDILKVTDATQRIYGLQIQYLK